MSNLKIFTFDNQEVRTFLINDDAWFVANDVARTLGYVNPSKATNDHCKKSVKMWGNDSLGRPQEFKIIPESDVYRLVFRSKLPEAEKFEDWVTEEVLPSIRSTGKYQSPMSQEDIMIATLETQKEIKKQLSTVSQDVEDLKKEVDLSRYQKSQLSKLVRKNVMDAVNGKSSNAYRELYRTAIAEHWREIKNHFDVVSYEEIPKLRFEEAMEVAAMWRPSASLAYDIKQLNTQTELEV